MAKPNSLLYLVWAKLLKENEVEHPVNLALVLLDHPLRNLLQFVLPLVHHVHIVLILPGYLPVEIVQAMTVHFQDLIGLVLHGVHFA